MVHVDFSVFSAAVVSIGFLFRRVTAVVYFLFPPRFASFPVAPITTPFQRFFDTAYGLRREMEFLDNLHEFFP